MTERDISLWRRDQTPRSSTARVSLSGAVIGRAEESESGMFRQKKVARDAWQEKVARDAARDATPRRPRPRPPSDTRQTNARGQLGAGIPPSIGSSRSRCYRILSTRGSV
jgi:hypothetical protein